LERDAPLDTASSFVAPGVSADASGPWNPVAAGEIPNCRPAGVTVQPAAVTGPRLPAACAGAAVARTSRKTRSERRGMRAGGARVRSLRRGGA
jgi:hypothetical protein